MYCMIEQGKIKPFWDIEFIKKLPFQKYPVPNYEQWKEAKHYPKDMVTDSLCSDKTADDLGIDWQWTDQLHVDDWKINAVSIYKLSPGKVTPWHTDHFMNFRKYYNLGADQVINRRLLFLQDWQPGQIFAIDDKTYTNWHAGDWIGWTQEHYHMGANHSGEIRYTAQLTGVK